MILDETWQFNNNNNGKGCKTDYWQCIPGFYSLHFLVEYDIKFNSIQFNNKIVMPSLVVIHMNVNKQLRHWHRDNDVSMLKLNVVKTRAVNYVTYALTVQLKITTSLAINRIHLVKLSCNCASNKILSFVCREAAKAARHTGYDYFCCWYHLRIQWQRERLCFEISCLTAL